MLEAVAIGAAGAGAGLLLIAVFRVVDRAVRPLDRAPVAKATVGGLGIGLVALVAGEETLFSGEHELETLLDNPGAKSIGALLLIVGGKMVALSLSLATGFRGGRVFRSCSSGGRWGSRSTRRSIACRWPLPPPAEWPGPRW